MVSIALINLLISNAVTSRKDKTILYSRIASICFFFLIFLSYNNFHYSFLKKGISLYSGLLYINSITFCYKTFIILLAFFIITLTSFYSRKIIIPQTSSLTSMFTYSLYYKSVIVNKMGHQFKIIEYSLLLLFVIIGTIFLISSDDLVTIFIALELQSYGLYLISACYRDSESATAGALMYFLLGGLSSCFILLGTALLYLNSGTLNLDNLYIINTISKTSIATDNIIYWYNSFYLNISLLLISTGLLFKISAAPFHFWSPDVYDAIPTIVTTFVSIIAKISILILLLELVYYSSKTSFNFYWTKSLLVSSLLSLIVGTVLGLIQVKIKRLYAYSTISHIGFILLALSINSVESIQSFMFYLIQYSLSNLNAFIILLSIGYLLYFYKNKGEETYKQMQEIQYSPVQYISQLKGYTYLNPILTLSLSITLFSFIGVPPLVGFLGKQMILTSALDNGYVFMSLVAIVTSMIGAVYYLQIIKQLYFYNPDYKLELQNENVRIFKIKKTLLKDIETNKINIVENEKIPNSFIEKENLVFTNKNITLSSYFSISISILTLIILLFMFMPSEILRLITILSLYISE